MPTRTPSDTDVATAVDGYIAETEEIIYYSFNPKILDLNREYICCGDPGFDRRLKFDVVDDQCIIGTPAQASNNFAAFRHMGVEQFMFRTRFQGMTKEAARQSIELFRSDVIAAVYASIRQYYLI